jgi:hypothetical protein
VHKPRVVLLVNLINLGGWVNECLTAAGSSGGSIVRHGLIVT